MDKSCNECTHFYVCKYRIDSQDLTPKFVDYDAPNTANWLKNFWSILAERCNYFKSKSDEA